MSQDAEEALDGAGGLGPISQCGTQVPFVLREGALGVGAMTVHATREPAMHLAAVDAFGPPAMTAGVHGDHRGSHAQRFAAHAVIGLAVVAGVRQDPVPHEFGRPLDHDRDQMRTVVPGSSGDFGGQPEIAARVAQDGELGPAPRPETAGCTSMSEIVAAGVMVFEPGGIDGPFRLRVDQAEALSALEDSMLESLKSPFFRSRFSAFSRVVQWGTEASSRSKARRMSDQSKAIWRMPRKVVLKKCFNTRSA